MPPKKKVVVADDSASGEVSPRSDVIQRLRDKLNAKAKISFADEAELPFHIRRPTGIPSLDLALGGGFPAGTINQIFGRPGTCKTYLANRIAAQVQQIYKERTNIAIASFGYRHDKDFARNIGGLIIPYSEAEIFQMREHNKRLYGCDITPEELEFCKTKMGNIIFIEPSDMDNPAESVFTALIECIKTAEFQLVILDETNMGETKWGVEKGLDESDRTADLAGLITKFLKKFYNAIKVESEEGRMNETTFIEILEPRDKVSMMSHGGLNQGGGNALRHAKVVDLHLSSYKDYTVGETVVGKEIEWKFDKAKMGIKEGNNGTLIWKHGYGIDVNLDVLNLGIRYGMVHKSGSWFALATGERLGQGAEKASQALAQIPGFVERLMTHAHGAEKTRPYSLSSL